MSQENHTLGRRQFTKLGAAALGLSAFGSTVVAAESTERFIVERNGDRSLPGNVVHDLSAVGYAVVEASETELERSDAVKSFAPDTVYELDLPVEQVTTDDAADAVDEPRYWLQWDKQDQNIPAVHDITTGAGGRVAIIDSGVDAAHPDLEHAVNVGLSRDFTGDGYEAGNPAGGYHGTHVAGIVAASAANDAGVVGSAPDTELLDLRVFSQQESASFADILSAMVYAAETECDAANLSLGAYPVPRQAIGQFYGKALNRIAAYGRRKGTVYVISAGNNAADLQHDENLVSLPNEAANVLSISATGPMGFAGSIGASWSYDTTPAESPAVYTNYGTNAVDLGAPGGNYNIEAYLDDRADDGSANGSDNLWYLDMVLNTVSDPVFDDDGNYVGSEPGYSWLAGTSMAAPQVSGAVALVRSLDPDANANQVRQYLTQTASVPSGYEKTYYGAGYLDTLAAVQSAD